MVFVNGLEPPLGATQGYFCFTVRGVQIQAAVVRVERKAGEHLDRVHGGTAEQLFVVSAAAQNFLVLNAERRVKELVDQSKLILIFLRPQKEAQATRRLGFQLLQGRVDLRVRVWRVQGHVVLDLVEQTESLKRLSLLRSKDLNVQLNQNSLDGRAEVCRSCSREQSLHSAQIVSFEVESDKVEHDRLKVEILLVQSFDFLLVLVLHVLLVVLQEPCPVLCQFVQDVGAQLLYIRPHIFPA